jgi:hypothetical protein
MTKFDPTEPVQTRDGRKARILCTDFRGTGVCPILAAVTCSDGTEKALSYFQDGRFEMIERVAKRCAAAAGFTNRSATHFSETPNGNDPDEERAFWRYVARAAIEAMREPTEAMVGAAFDAVSHCDHWHIDHNGDYRRAHRAMIDAALAEDR